MFESDHGEKEVNLGRRLFLSGMGAAMGGAALFSLRQAACDCGGGEDGAGGSDDCAILRCGQAAGEGEDCARGEVGRGVEKAVAAGSV